MIGWLLRQESVRSIALVRIGIALLIAQDTLASWRYSVELYSSAGPAMPVFFDPVAQSPSPRAAVSDQVAAADAPPTWSHLLTAIPSPRVAIAAQTLLCVVSLALAVGWQTRLSLVLTLVLLAWLKPLDVSWTFAKYTVIWLHALACLLLGGGATDLSVDSLQNGTRQTAGPATTRRLLQLLVCQVYLGAAVTKLKSPWFAGGELLQFSLLDRGWGGTSLGQWLATSSLTMRALSLGTILFELLFPFLIWVPACRRPLLLVAVLFHLGVWGAMHVGTFSPTMLVLLLTFAEPDQVARICNSWRRFRTPPESRSHEEAVSGGPPAARPATRGRWNSGSLRGLSSLGTYALTAVTVVIVAGAIQWWCDWYGVFGNRSLARLTRIPPAVVDEVRAARKPAFEDYVHRVTVGNWRGERDVGGSGPSRRGTDRLYVLVQFVIPHPNLRLEGLLLASDGRLAARFEHTIDAGLSYAINGFELTTELPPGSSRVILQIEGHEVASRKVEIR